MSQNHGLGKKGHEFSTRLLSKDMETNRMRGEHSAKASLKKWCLRWLAVVCKADVIASFRVLSGRLFHIVGAA